MLQIVFKKRNWNFQNTFNNLLFITNFFLISHMLSDLQMKNYFITGNKSKKNWVWFKNIPKGDVPMNIGNIPSLQ